MRRHTGVVGRTDLIAAKLPVTAPLLSLADAFAHRSPKIASAQLEPSLCHQPERSSVPASPVSVVFFDLGDTLGSPVLSPSPPRLVGFKVFPFVLELLQGLRARGLRLGIISNTGTEAGKAVDKVLEASGILSSFDAALRIYSADVGLTKATPEICELAAKRAGHAADPGACLFVGEDASERVNAQAAAMQVCPHPKLVNAALAGEELRFVRVTAPAGSQPAAWRSALQALAMVPMHVSGPEGRELYGIASERAVLQLANMGCGVNPLGEWNAPLVNELFLLRDDLAKESGALSSVGQSQDLLADDRNRNAVLSTHNGEVMFALAAGRSLSEIHFEHTRHGHTLKLIPDPLLLEPLSDQPLTRPAWSAEDVHAGLASAGFTGDPTLTPDELAQFGTLGESSIRRRIERYSGAHPFDANSPRTIASRHIHHADNDLVTRGLATELEAIGQGRLTVRLHPFSHMGRSLVNVEAELAGTSAEIVLVTAHLDSTAASSPDYDESRDAAPGADDDGSGVAAVLAIAEAILALSATRPLLRNVRFVLFNAEEEGLVGSRVYARQQRSAGAPIVAVFQMDMIGFNRVLPRSWEVHAGSASSADVERRSLALAKVLLSLSRQVSPQLEPPQIYASDSGPDGDPASGRSDHAPFQAHGYAACVASEDFFMGPVPDSPAAEENPNYHRTEDTFVDAAYAADIARVVGAAAWVVARSPTQ